MNYAAAGRGAEAGVRVVSSLSHGLQIAVTGDLLIIGAPGTHQVRQVVATASR